MTERGIDEAGLGPKLGPFVVAAVDWDPDRDWNTPAFSALSASAGVPVGDSKKIYRSGSPRGLADLEKTALALRCLSGGAVPRTVGELFPPKTLDELASIPWYAGIAEKPLPLRHTAGEIETAALLWERVCPARYKAKFELVPVPRFNRLLEETRNKAAACGSVIAPFLAETEAVVIRVDRQGGRRYYGEWLAALFPEVETVREEPERSVYRCGEKTIHFRVRGESRYPPVALASLCAKYARELCMACFNGWWRSRCPGIAPTAGYPVDAARFLKELDMRGASYDRNMLVRNR